MKSTEDWFRSLFDHAPDAIVIIDGAGEISGVNRQAEELFLYTADELIGKSIEVLVPESFRDAHRRHRAGYARQPKIRRMGEGMNLSALKADGTQFAAEISLSPIDLNGDRSVCTAIRDVSDRRRMEQQIIDAREEAERAHKANQAFLAAASHDLRQPVQALTLLNGALRRTVDNPKALEMIESQDRSLTAMTNLLNSLLDISRLDAGAVIPEPIAFPVQSLFDRFASEFARLAQQKGLSFTAEATGAVVKTDPDLLGEIVQNLVSNAIRYTEEGSVILRCLPIDQGFAIEVQDTGIGIEADEREAIFEAFHQSHARGKSNEGFGLGLAIVHRLCGLLDAAVTVDSTPGSGSTFRIELAGSLAEVEVGEDKVAAAAADAGAGCGRVLLVEDDSAVAHAWQLLLEAEGYEVSLARSLDEVGEVLPGLAEPPVLIISDYHLLDGPTGVQVIEKARAFFKHQIPAFVISGDTAKLAGAAKDIEDCTVLGKPVNPTELLALALAATRH